MRVAVILGECLADFLVGTPAAFLAVILGECPAAFPAVIPAAILVDFPVECPAVVAALWVAVAWLSLDFLATSIHTRILTPKPV